VLHLLRHAHAGDPEKWTGPDEKRPLSKRGLRQAERLAAFLADHGVQVDLLLTSPKLRASQTADSVAEALSLKPRIDERLAGSLDIARIDGLIRDADVTNVMLVGHDPDFSSLLAELCGAQALAMRKGALATLDVPRPIRPGEASLRWLVPPDLLGPD